MKPAPSTSFASKKRALMLASDALGSFLRHTTASGTRFSLQRPADVEAGIGVAAENASVWIVLFDGLPMIEDGVPEALLRAQASGVLPAVSAVYVESIEGAEKRGPTRCSSLTTAKTLDGLAADLDAFLVNSGRDEHARVVLVGHSLGAIAALHIASMHPSLSRDVVLLSGALWWPGDDGQLSGKDAMNEVMSAPEVRVWSTVGEREEQKLLASNDVLFARLGEVRRRASRRSHPGGHKVRPEDVVSGIQSLIGPPSS